MQTDNRHPVVHVSPYVLWASPLLERPREGNMDPDGKPVKR